MTVSSESRLIISLQGGGSSLCCISFDNESSFFPGDSHASIFFWYGLSNSQSETMLRRQSWLFSNPPGLGGGVVGACKFSHVSKPVFVYLAKTNSTSRGRYDYVTKSLDGLQISGLSITVRLFNSRVSNCVQV